MPYIKGITQGHKVTATFLQLQFGDSNDRLTRTMQKRFSWQHILLWVVTKFFSVRSNGYLIIDDTVIAKPFSKKLEGAGFAYSSSLDATIYGYHVVLLVWTNGILTIPLAWRFYRKNNKSKIKLAQELLELALNTWNINTTTVLFDSYYVAGKLLNQINEYDWTFTCRIKKNQIVNSASVNDNLT